MLVRNKIGIIQKLYKGNNGQLVNEYHFDSGRGIYLGGLLFPPDGQVTEDVLTLEVITSAYAARWGLIPPKKMTTSIKKQAR